MTRGVASRSALVCGARQALWAVLSCSGFWGCLGEPAELFSELPSADPAAADGSSTTPAEASSTEPPPASADVPANGTGVDGSMPAASGSSELEQPGVIELDPGTTDGEGGGSSERPTPMGSTESSSNPPPDVQETPPSEAPPAEATPPDVGGPTNIAEACAGVTNPLLLDFTSPGADPTQALFGDFRDVLSGGTYVYPSLDQDAPPAGGLASDVTSGDWHIWGSVVQQAGFGLFLDCQLLDASRFTGLAFRVSGNVERASSITLLIGTASNEVSRAWLIANDITSPRGSGRCTPATNEYDGTCSQARLEIPVSPQAREVLVPFSALGQGSPEPGVNPAEITTIAWALPSPQVNRFGQTSAYDVDLRIDDIRFIEGPAPLF